LNDDYVVPNGESYTAFIARTRRAFEEIRERYIGETICVVTHGGVIDSVRHNLVNDDRCGSGRCGNASISEVVARGKVWSLVKWNDVSHLAKLQKPILVADDVLERGSSDGEE